MATSATGNLTKAVHALTDKPSDKAQSGVRIAQDTARDAGSLLSSKIDDVRSEAGTAINRGAKQVQSASKRGLHAVSGMAGQARYAASTASDSIVAYTKENPVKALAIAAVSGAVLYALSKALAASRD